MNKPDSQDSSSGSKINPRRDLLIGVLAIGAITAGVKCGPDLPAAMDVNDQTQKLMSVKSFLEENKEKLKRYDKLGPQGMAQQAPAINKTLTGLIEEIKKAKEAADEIAKTDVRFSPNMFEGLEIALDIAVRKLSSGKIGRLNQEAAKMSKSGGKKGWGVYNRGARRRGISPGSVINMSRLVYQLKSALGELKNSLPALEQAGISGCSNNSVVDFAARAKLGINHCETFNTPFCKGVEELASKTSDKLKPTQAIAVQRRLIAHGVLAKNADDGDFSDKSNIAYSKAQGSAAFNQEVQACE